MPTSDWRTDRLVHTSSTWVKHTRVSRQHESALEVRKNHHWREMTQSFCMFNTTFVRKKQNHPGWLSVFCLPPQLNQQRAVRTVQPLITPARLHDYRRKHSDSRAFIKIIHMTATSRCTVVIINVAGGKNVRKMSQLQKGLPSFWQKLLSMIAADKKTLAAHHPNIKSWKKKNLQFTQTSSSR